MTADRRCASRRAQGAFARVAVPLPAVVLATTLASPLTAAARASPLDQGAAKRDKYSIGGPGGGADFPKGADVRCRQRAARDRKRSRSGGWGADGARQGAVRTQRPGGLETVDRLASNRGRGKKPRRARRRCRDQGVTAAMGISPWAAIETPY
jgi:hypothetical protein